MDRIEIEYLPKEHFQPYLSFNDNTYNSYEYLGAHIMKYNDLEGVSFTVLAPNAEKVNVVGDFNRWDGQNFPMKKIGDTGIWHIFISGLKEGSLYKYEIHTKANPVILKADPYGFYSEVRPNTASIVVSLKNYEWNDEKWRKGKNNKSKYEQPINIYELHLGSWKRKRDGEFYNYKEIVDELIEYVITMGYTHIELMPLSEYPFDGSWGYQVTGYYSITSRYGKPQDFMYFVDRCHQAGLGIILDWVPGHFCKDEHGLAKFDGTTLYEYDNPMMAENLEWGTAVFDHGKVEVENYLISNALFWLNLYHIDGLRVDAVSYMLYLDSGRKDGMWQPNKNGGRENLGAIEFIKKLNQTVSNRYPNVLMIAEESTPWPNVTGPLEIGGLGFDYKWNMGWMNDMLKYMELDPIYRKWHHNLITFSFTYAFSERYILPLSHDEVVHGKKSLIEKMPGDYWKKFANLRVFYGYMIAHPGKKLLFMGDEFAHFIEWNCDKELDWMLLGYENHRKMKLFVKCLNDFYKTEKALYESENDHRGFSWIDHQNYDESVITFMRKGREEDDFIIIVCNFTPIPRFNYKIGVPKLGCYQEVINSDLKAFGGSGVTNEESIKADDLKWHNQPYSIEITIPPLGSLYIKLKKTL